MYRIDRSWDGSHRVRPTSADEEIGAAVGGALGWAVGAGVDGLGALARNSRDRKMIRLAQEINAAEETGDVERLLTLSAECVRRYPREEYGHAQLSLALGQKGRTDEAIAELDRAVALGFDAGEAHLHRGQLYLEASRIGQAIQEFTAVAHQPQLRPMALIGRVFCLCELDDLDQAVREADQAVAAAPDAMSYSIRAGVYRRREDLPKCLADLSRSLQLDPSDADVREMRADVYEELGRTADAEADRAAIRPPAEQVAADRPAAQSTEQAHNTPPPGPSGSRNSTTTRSPRTGVLLLGAGVALFLIGAVTQSGGTIALGLVLLIATTIWLIVATR
jgi:tetratricopeptide (TPR) repeat protein